MARNRFAQPLYGKIIYIYETDLTMDQLSTVFDPGTYWIDVTGLDCEVGYTLEFVEGGGLRFVPSPSSEPLTFEEEKTNKIALMKAERDRREASNISYKDIELDFDEVSRERMDRAEKYLINKNLEGILWTCADNSRAILTVDDFKNVNDIAAERSAALHDKYNLLKDYIEVIETKEELESVIFDMDVPDISTNIWGADYIVDDTASTGEPTDNLTSPEISGDPVA